MKGETKPKFQIITMRDTVMKVPDKWKLQYYDREADCWNTVFRISTVTHEPTQAGMACTESVPRVSAGEIYESLVAIRQLLHDKQISVLEARGQMDEAVGNGSWTRMECHLCGADVMRGLYTARRERLISMMLCYGCVQGMWQELQTVKE